MSYERINLISIRCKNKIVHLKRMGDPFLSFSKLVSRLKFSQNYWHRKEIIPNGSGGRQSSLDIPLWSASSPNASFPGVHAVRQWGRLPATSPLMFSATPNILLFTRYRVLSFMIVYPYNREVSMPSTNVLYYCFVHKKLSWCASCPFFCTPFVRSEPILSPSNTSKYRLQLHLLIPFT